MRQLATQWQSANTALNKWWKLNLTNTSVITNLEPVSTANKRSKRSTFSNTRPSVRQVLLSVRTVAVKSPIRISWSINLQCKWMAFKNLANVKPFETKHRWRKRACNYRFTAVLQECLTSLWHFSKNRSLKIYSRLRHPLIYRTNNFQTSWLVSLNHNYRTCRSN